MENKQIIVPQQLVSDAYRNFIKIYYPNSTGKGFYFWNFVGECATCPDGNWMFNKPSAVKYIKMLAGPYYETIAKVMILRGCDPHSQLTRSGKVT